MFQIRVDLDRDLGDWDRHLFQLLLVVMVFLIKNCIFHTNKIVLKSRYANLIVSHEYPAYVERLWFVSLCVGQAAILVAGLALSKDVHLKS